MGETKENKKSWIEVLGTWSQRYIPDAFSLVLVLTLLVGVMAIIFTDGTPISILRNWYDGFWAMLTFTISVTMVMFTGFLVANSRPVSNLLMQLSRMPKTTNGAILLYLLVTIILFYIHFALGMAAAILFGKSLIVEQDKKGNRLPISLVAAAAGFCIVFQGGPTANASLVVASEGHFLQDVTGILPITTTSLSLPMILMNVILAAIFVLVFPRLATILSKGERDEADQEILARFQNDIMLAQNSETKKPVTFAEKFDNFKWIQMFIGFCGLVLVLIDIVKGGLANLSFNSLNMLFMMLALILHQTPNNLTKAAKESITSVSGIVLQFPFYAGIFGILSYSGLGEIIINAFVAIAPARFFTVIVLWFTGLLNMLVPSAGSQFVVEAPYIVPAAVQLGVDPAAVVNAFTCGDLLTNLIQPFWAIPVLSAYGVKFRNIFPYCLVAFVISFVVLSVFFMFFMAGI